MAEPDIPLVVQILDVNDNAPYFELHSGNITESSERRTSDFEHQSSPSAHYSGGAKIKRAHQLYVVEHQPAENHDAFPGGTVIGSG